MAVVLLAALLVAAIGSAFSAGICRGPPGAYHLSCYTDNLSVSRVREAKDECLESFEERAVGAGCNSRIIEAAGNIYGCGTGIIYAFETAACLAAYQTQENTNNDCEDYRDYGLGSSANRMTSTALTNNVECAGTQGPCPSGVSGYFHLGCYTRSLSEDAIVAAKEECIGSFVQSMPECVPLPRDFVDDNDDDDLDLMDLEENTGDDYFGCAVYTGYGFTTQACLDAYQAQESSNGMCRQCISRGLGDAANRMTATAPSSYTCGTAAAGSPTPAATSPTPAARSPTPAARSPSPTPVTLGSPPLLISTGICRGIPGAYHLSCYTDNFSVNRVEEAKDDCLESFEESSIGAGCNSRVIEVARNIYGCDTGIIYAFETATCLATYQAQESTNRNCDEYINYGLGSSANRMTSTAPANDIECTGTQGPCPSVASGFFHLSCYTRNLSEDAVVAAKEECIGRFVQSMPECVPLPEDFEEEDDDRDLMDLEENTGDDYFGCAVYTGYGFTTQACLDAYQAQEKSNSMCYQYISRGLGNAANRMNATAPSSYTCGNTAARAPAPPPTRNAPNPSPSTLGAPPPFSPTFTDICRGPPGAYHLSCYTANLSVSRVEEAKDDCLESFEESTVGYSCNSRVIEVASNIYGCGTGIIYAFETATCLAAYQAQENVNSNCDEYTRYGLGSSANRMTSTAPANNIQCTGTQGPCPSRANGYFHLSCYTRNLSEDAVVAAKEECIGSFVQSMPECIPLPEDFEDFDDLDDLDLMDLEENTGDDYFGCAVYTGYGFTTQACLDAYQAQEKSNRMCYQYISRGLGDAANRMDATAPSSYTCGNAAAIAPAPTGNAPSPSRNAPPPTPVTLRAPPPTQASCVQACKRRCKNKCRRVCVRACRGQ